MHEDLKRRKLIKNITNFLAFSSVVDSVVTVALLIYLFRFEELAGIPILIACMQISSHEFLVLISSVLLIQTGSRHFDRIDACGAWMIIHFLVAIGNVSFVTFEYLQDTLVIFHASWYKNLLLGWKEYFILVELFGIIYCFYVVHNPIAYVKSKRTPHPLFTENSNTRTVAMETDPRNRRNHSNGHTRPQSAVIFTDNVATTDASNQLRHNNRNHGYNRNSYYESYQSLTSVGTDTPVRYTRNPAYESELSLDYANNYSPYDHMMMSNRNRLSYVEPIPEVGENRTVEYGTMNQ